MKVKFALILLVVVIFNAVWADKYLLVKLNSKGAKSGPYLSKGPMKRVKGN